MFRRRARRSRPRGRRSLKNLARVRGGRCAAGTPERRTWSLPSLQGLPRGRRGREGVPRPRLPTWDGQPSASAAAGGATVYDGLAGCYGRAGRRRGESVMGAGPSKGTWARSRRGTGISYSAGCCGARLSDRRGRPWRRRCGYGTTYCGQGLVRVRVRRGGGWGDDRAARPGTLFRAGRIRGIPGPDAHYGLRERYGAVTTVRYKRLAFLRRETAARD